ncbi:MAG TPA: beta-ketoacyl-ACP reductase [Candidatus Baltobacteraceae bacterium]|nr:beta-ketoacyl-ACP reductase [Candidatus Baltobacteraceae bacterium]
MITTSTAPSGTLTRLEGRVAIVTGGSRGIGGAISTALAADGATIAVVGVPADRERTEALRASLNGTAKLVDFYQADVSDPQACEAATQAVIAAHGKVDILINSAGITKDHTARKMTVDEWQAVLNVNLSGPFFMIKAVLDHMLAQRYGRIVNISSVVGRTGNFGQANYAAAKAGLLGLTKTLAIETARTGITVNAVAPGFTLTEMVAAMPETAIEAATARTPIGRLGQPEEIARVVRFLVDDNSGFITGSTYDVNGGMYM